MIIERKDTRCIVLNEHGEIEYRNRNGELVAWAQYNEKAKQIFEDFKNNVVWGEDDDDDD